jgi:hypothetical protein
MYVERIIEARLYNNSCCRKTISIAYSDSVFVALYIQHAMCMRYVVVWGPSFFTVYFYIIS